MALDNKYRSSVIEDDEDKYMQIERVYRLSTQGGIFSILFDIFLRVFMSTLFYSGPIIGLLIFVLFLMPNDYRIFIVYLQGIVWVAGLVFAYSMTRISYYDKKNKCFVLENFHFWRKTSGYTWPLDVFEGISYGTHFTSSEGG